MKEEQNTINEAKKEKATYLEAGKHQIGHYLETIKQQAEA
jgi:hypothetical protein